MNGKYKRRAAILLCGAAVLVSGSVFASQTVSTISRNVIATGSLQGRIEEIYSEKELYPGSVVSKIVNVRNTGTSDMLVRLRAEKYFEDLSLNPEMIDVVYNSNCWTEEDGWHYYNRILKAGEKTEEPLMESFSLSHLAGNEYAGASGEVRISMECVQAEGDGISIWDKTAGGLGIEKIEQTRPENIAAVEFMDFEQGFSAASENRDLFRKFKDLLPGEHRSQNIRIINRSGEKTGIYLSALTTEQEEENRELVKKLIREYCTLLLTDENGEVIYKGPADGNPEEQSGKPNTMRNDILLGEFAAGEEKTIQAALTVSPEMDNRYQELLGRIDWRWTARRGEESITAPNLGAEPGNKTLLYLSGCCCVLSALVLFLLNGAARKGVRRNEKMEE